MCKKKLQLSSTCHSGWQEKIWWLQFVVDIDIVVQAVAVVVTNNETGDNFDDAAADASEGMIVIISKVFLLCV